MCYYVVLQKTKFPHLRTVKIPFLWSKVRLSGDLQEVDGFIFVMTLFLNKIGIRYKIFGQYRYYYIQCFIYFKQNTYFYEIKNQKSDISIIELLEWRHHCKLKDYCRYDKIFETNQIWIELFFRSQFSNILSQRLSASYNSPERRTLGQSKHTIFFASFENPFMCTLSELKKKCVHLEFLIRNKSLKVFKLPKLWLKQTYLVFLLCKLFKKHSKIQNLLKFQLVSSQLPKCENLVTVTKRFILAQLS